MLVGVVPRPSRDELHVSVSGPDQDSGDDRWVVKGGSMTTILDQELEYGLAMKRHLEKA